MAFQVEQAVILVSRSGILGIGDMGLLVLA
jgi:hypothetical protein